MEKKLKINFILKGIAVFAFVAFCLLAILAGVTLPFVSNASTADSAVASAENDCATASAESDTFNPLDFCIPLSQCNTTDTYYGFYITQDFYNTIKSFNFGDIYIHLVGTFSIVGSGADSLLALIYDTDTNVKSLRASFGDGYLFELGSSLISYNYNNIYYITDKGFKFSSIETNTFNNSLMVFNQLPFGGDTSALENQIATLTAEKNALQTQVNNLTDENKNLKNRLGFNSEFGFIGNLRSNRIYFNLKFAPKIPSDKLCPYGENAIINGYYKQDNDFYLPVLVAYDSSGNEVTAGFTGWKFTCVLNPDGSPTTSFRLDFFVENLAVYYIDSVELNGKCFTTPDYSHGYAIVGADYVGDGISVYSSPKSQYFYDLKPNYFSQSQVRNFLAFFHYLTYEPVEDAFYLAGLNAASKGYYDDGYKQGYDVGNTDGYNNGFSAGDSKGYQRGLDDANNYTFLSLFGAIFDAPIQALFGGTQRLPAGTKITDSSGKTITLTSDTVVNRGGMLNFELMGVNLSGFVLALFSLSIIIIVIKFALAKR